eukprot:Gb_27788 [translate_table: standard]
MALSFPYSPSSPLLVYFHLYSILTIAGLQSYETTTKTILNPKSTLLSATRDLPSIALPLMSRSVSTSPSALINSLAAHALQEAKKDCQCAISQPSTKLYFHYNVSLVVPMMLGTPPQQVLMVVDTGSELSWVQCLSCPTCSNGQQSSFNPFISSSHTNIPCNSLACTRQTRDFTSPTSCDDKKLCHFSYSYADGTSSEGNLARETVGLGNDLTMPGLVFGCVNSSFLSKSSGESATGIMGLNRGALSFIQQFHGNYPKKFSYCIADPAQFPTSSGVLVFGVSPYSNILNYTPLVRLSLPLPYFNKVAYSVKLEGIKVAEKLLPLPKSVFMPDHTGAGQTMIDSGTQFTFLMGPVYSALKHEFLHQTQGRLHSMKDRDFSFEGVLDLCYTLPRIEPFPQLPSVTLMFESAEVKLDGHQLLYPVPKESARGTEVVYCFTFGNSDLVPVEANIIGNHHQQNLWIEYDLENSRVGFAPAACNMG